VLAVPENALMVLGPAVSGVLVPGFGALLGDGVNGNDAPYLDTFPYLGHPFPGNR